MDVKYFEVIKMTDNAGFRIWEIDEKTKVPKKFLEGTWEEYHEFPLDDLDLDNKTYAVRIGKEGLK